MLDVNDETLSGPCERTHEKQKILSDVEKYGVRRLMPVYCDTDPSWALRLLKAAAPLLEELDLWNAEPKHWQLLPTMKRLLRVEVNYYFTKLAGIGGAKFQLPALPAVDPADEPMRLLWLRVCLPREAVVDLVQRNAATLRELQVFVGTGGKPDPVQGHRGWPWSCGAEELAAVLQQCQLKVLRRLVLRRPHKPVMTLCGDFTHHAEPCRAQMAAVRRALPSVEQVLCGTCDQVVWRCFEETIFGIY